MMALFTYLWQSAVVLTVLYIPFQLLLRKEQFFALNRGILLGILTLSLLLPLSHHTMPGFVENWLHPQVEPLVTPVFELGEAEVMDDLVVLKQDAVIETPSWIELHWLEMIISVWLLGSMLFLLWQAKGLWKLYWILHDKGNICEKMADGITLLLISAELPSFSWMHSIVISEDDYAENRETILTHERAHIAYHHSLDRLLLFVVQALQWWNPFVWLLADSLAQVHEYQADLAVLRQGINATQYQLLLIRKAAGPAGLALVNGFKRNKLKLRIVMMNNMIKIRGAKSRYLALLPMMLLAVAFTARAQVTTRDNQNATTEPSTVNYYGTFTAWDNDEVMSVVDQEPEYPGGVQGLMAFIGENLRYPKACAEQGIEGRVMLSFVVEKDGSVSHVEEMRSPDSLLTDEAMRVIKVMPKWTPGMQDGQPVRVRYILPVTFRLDGQSQGSNKEKDASQSNPISDRPYSPDMLFIYDGNVVEYETIKDLPPAEISIGNIQILKNGNIYEEYVKKYPKAKNGVVIMNSYSRKDQLWVVDGVPMTGEDMEAKFAHGGLTVQFHQVHKDAETLAKYNQYPQAKNGVNVVLTDKE